MIVLSHQITSLNMVKEIVTATSCSISRQKIDQCKHAQTFLAIYLSPKWHGTILYHRTAANQIRHLLCVLQQQSIFAESSPYLLKDLWQLVTCDGWTSSMEQPANRHYREHHNQQS